MYFSLSIIHFPLGAREYAAISVQEQIRLYFLLEKLFDYFLNYGADCTPLLKALQVCVYVCLFLFFGILIFDWGDDDAVACVPLNIRICAVCPCCEFFLLEKPIRLPFVNSFQ